MKLSIAHFEFFNRKTVFKCIRKNFVYIRWVKISRCMLYNYGCYTVTPQRIWKWGHVPVRSESGGTDPAQSAGQIVFLVVPLHFLALKAQLVVWVSAFVMVSTVCTVSCLWFFYSRCPPCAAICKSGGTCLSPRAPCSRRHCCYIIPVGVTKVVQKMDLFLSENM